jgi:hypothetical protein
MVCRGEELMFDAFIHKVLFNLKIFGLYAIVASDLLDPQVELILRSP